MNKSIRCSPGTALEIDKLKRWIPKDVVSMKGLNEIICFFGVDSVAPVTLTLSDYVMRMKGCEHDGYQQKKTIFSLGGISRLVCDQFAN